MHVEPPKAPHGWREFLREYGMIVLSVLTALALERVAVDWSNRSDAAVSRVRIERELRADLADLHKSEADNRQSLAQARAMLERLLPLLAAGRQADAVAAVKQDKNLGSFSVSTPSWQHGAWDTAIADRSAEHMDAGELSRFAAAYTSAEDLDRVCALVLSGTWFDTAAGLFLGMQTGSIDPGELAKFLIRYMIALETIEATEQRLDKKTEAALGK